MQAWYLMSKLADRKARILDVSRAGLPSVVPFTAEPRSLHNGALSSALGRDEFILEWVRKWLGPNEIRHVVLLAIGLSGYDAEMSPDSFLTLSEDFRSTVKAKIEATGGHIVEDRQSSVIGCWGGMGGKLAHLAQSLGAAKSIMQSSEWRDRTSAVLDCGPGLIQPQPNGFRLTSTMSDNAQRLLPTTHPGEIVITPSAHAIVTTPDGDDPSKIANNDARSMGFQRIEIERTIEVLRQCPSTCDLHPAVHAMIAEIADGIPALALAIAQKLSPAEIDGNCLARIAETTNPISVLLAQQLDRTGPARGLARAAAVCGDFVDAQVLAIALETSQQALISALDDLVRLGVLEHVQEDRSEQGRTRRGRALDIAGAKSSTHASGGKGSCAGGYRFVSRLLRQVARHSLPAEPLRRLHRRIANTMVTQCEAGNDLDIAEIAEHFAQAGEVEKAIRWWQLAAERAIKKSAAHSAVQHLESALAYLPDSVDLSQISDEQELTNSTEITRLLGPQLAAMKGNASEDVLSNYQRHAEVISQVQPASSMAKFDALWGMQTFYVVRGNMWAAQQTGRLVMECATAIARMEQTEMPERATGATASDALILGHRMQGLTSFMLGHFRQASAHYEWVLEHYDEERHSDLRHHYASDQAALAQAHGAWTSALRGNDEHTQARSHAALKMVERIDHPHTSAHVVSVLAAVELCVRAPDNAMLLAMAGRALAQRHGFPYWSAWCGLILSAVETGRSSATALSEITRAVRDYAATGASQALPFGYALLAERALHDGQFQTALGALNQGLQEAHKTGVAYYVPELLRLYGIARHGLGHSDYQTYLHQARRKAVQFGATFFEKNISATIIELS